MNTVELEIRDDGVGVVRLNRPELNIYNLEMRDDLIEAFRAVRDLPEVRAVVLAANGRHFSAGADLSEFGTAESVFEARRIRWWRDPWLALLDSPKPSVAALHGYSLGAGLEMALMCDFRLAAPDTRVGLPETKLGMLPSAGGSQTLARLLGPGRALPVVLRGENHSAADALRMGLLDDVVEDGGVDAAAVTMAARLAALHPARAGAAKRALRAAADLPLAAGLELERHLARMLAATVGGAGA
jgi:enoyl-CoA hydratase/carnithine racemase